MRFCLQLGAIAAAAGYALLNSSAVLAQAQKPNVIVFLADDMGFGDSSAYVGKKLEAGGDPIPRTVVTPNLERLANMGTLFTDVHSSSSMCSTSRYGLLTGRYAWRSNQQVQVLPNWESPPMIDDQRQTIGNLMQRAGYTTTAIGKWHLGTMFADAGGNPVTPAAAGQTLAFYNSVRWPTAADPNVTSILTGPTQHGFDSYFGVLTNNQSENGNFRGFVQNNTVLGIPSWNGGLPTVAGWDTTKADEAFANQALNQIDAFAGVGGSASTKPLFMYYAATANHADYSPPVNITLQGQTHDIRDQSRLTDGSNSPSREDLVYENDVILGALLDKLQNTTDPLTGQAMINNTLIIFTSDNGSDRTTTNSDAGLRDKKRSIYEGGHRVPFVAAWPGHTPQGVVSDQVFGLNDLYASLANLTGTGLSQTEAEDSENVLPALLGQSTAQFQRPSNLIVHDDSFVNDITDGAVLAVRSGNVKLILSNALVNNPTQPAGTAGRAVPIGLYDLSVDPHENNNLISNPAYAGLLEQLRREALQVRNQGFSRTGMQQTQGPLLATDGGATLANSLGGAVGYEFTVGAAPIIVTRLGMWDDGLSDVINQENRLTNPDGDTVGVPDGLATNHVVRLFDKSTGAQVASLQVTNANSTVEGEFRYVSLPNSLALYAGRTYALTMSTTASDGDLFHSSVPFSGTGPVSTLLLADFAARRASTDGAYPSLLPDGTTATGAPAEELYADRFFVGPTAMLASIPVSMADFDFDGDADGNDFLIWQRGLGMSNPTRANGDADLDGVVGALDLQLWRAAFATSSAWLAAGGAVPEPSSAACGCAALTALISRRRRRNRRRSPQKRQAG
jgi:arylsulfatase A-like enzyme